MSKQSITQKTREALKERGFVSEKVEKYNAFTKRYNDLFGVWDVLGVGNGETIAVQVTSRAHISERVKKIEESEHIGAVRDAGWILEVHGWDKYKNRYRCKIVDVS